MNWFYDTVAAVKRHGNAWSALFYLLGLVAAVVLYIIFGEILCLAAASMFFPFLMWDIDDSLNKERRAELIRFLANKSDEVVLLKAELAKKDEEIEIYKKTAANHKDNPIKSNRLVSDKTFAVRFRSFVEAVRVIEPIGEEEKEYLHHVAERLLKWQTKTVRKDTEEYKYLERLGLMPEPSQNTKEHTKEVKRDGEKKIRTKPKRKPKKEASENENQN